MTRTKQKLAFMNDSINQLFKESLGHQLKINQIEQQIKEKKETNTMIIEMNNDAVNHPSHYCDGGIETIDYIRAKLSREEFIGYCKGNALKYISRAGKKAENSLKQDLSKAITYLKWAEEVAE